MFFVFQNILIYIKCFLAGFSQESLRGNDHMISILMIISMITSYNQISSLSTINLTTYNPVNADITSWYNRNLLNFIRGSFTWYVRKIFEGSAIHKHVCACQGVRFASFSDDFAYVLNDDPQYKSKSYHEIMFQVLAMKPGRLVFIFWYIVFWKLLLSQKYIQLEKIVNN